MFDYKIDLSAYYPSNENKFNIYVDEMTNKVATNVSLPYVISMNIWKSSYTIYLENLSEGCGEIREIVVDGYVTTTTTMNFILTTTQYVAPTTLFTTTTTTTTTSTTITTITTQYVPPTTVATTASPTTPAPTTESPTPTTTTTTEYVPPPVGSKRWYNAPASRTLTRSNCPDGCTAGSATYHVESGVYSVDREEGIDGQADADLLATIDLDNNAQTFVDNNASCTDCPSTLHWNTEQTIEKTSNECGDCETLPVTFIIDANKYSSELSVNDANDKALSENQGNAQENANLNGKCNCPPEIKHLIISTGVSDCMTGINFVSVGGYDGVPYEGGNYEFWIDTQSSTFTTSYGIAGLSNGIHIAYVKDAAGTIAQKSFNITCPEETTTTTTTTAQQCDCHRGIIGNNGQFAFTDCFGSGNSGYAGGGEGGTEICYDITKTNYNIQDLGTHEICACG